MSAEMTPEYMRGRWAGVFADAPDPPALDPLSEAITAAQNQLNTQASWGRNYEEAVVLLAGHIALLGTAARASGAIRTKAGQVEVEYGVGAGGMTSSSFYTLYLQLLARQAQFRIFSAED